MKRRGVGRRQISILLAAAMLFLSVPPIEGFAGSKPSVYSKMTDSYKSSVYYQRLMEVELTGNQVTDLIAVAASQLGYTEGTDKNNLSGDGKGSGDCTEYGNWLGKNKLPWCASFVSWCFEEAGIPTSIMPRSAGCGVLRNSVYNKGATWHGVDSGYKPKAGDLVMYEKLVQMDDGNWYYVYADRDKNGVPDTSSHVGIVVSDFNTSKQTYDVIDGNGNQGRVKYLAGQKLYMAGPVYGGGTMNRIQGFITPAYTTGSGTGYSGNSGSSGTVKQPLNVTLTKATDPQYTAKEKVEETNAVVVSRVSKTAGSSITTSGLTLWDADGSVIKEHTERVTNVSSSTTVFHTWYDIQKELGVTLKPGTSYTYQFCVVVDGQTFRGERYPLRTKGASVSENSASSGQVSSAGSSQVSSTSVGQADSVTRMTSNDGGATDTISIGGNSGAGTASVSADTSSTGAGSTTDTTGTSTASSRSSKASTSKTSSTSTRSSRSTTSSSGQNQSSGSVSILAPSYYGTGTWMTGMGGRAWRLRRVDGSYLGSQWGLIDGAWYLFGSDGYTRSGWQRVDGTWYYLYPNAAMATGWVSVDGHWYYLDGSGAMRTGWQLVSGKWYYLDASGAMLADTMTPDGYWVDADGVWIR